MRREGTGTSTLEILKKDKALTRVWNTLPLAASASTHTVRFEPKKEKPSGSFVGALYEKIKRVDHQDRVSRHLWLGKLGTPDVLLTSPTYQARDALKEKLADDLYYLIALQTQFAFDVPKTRLGNLPILNPFTNKDELAKSIYKILNDGRASDKAVDTSMHVMSRWIEGYQDLNKALVPVDGASPELFPAYFKRTGKISDLILVKGHLIPLRGLLELFAASRLVGDINVLGNGFSNAGFVVTYNQRGNPVFAQVIKIDSSYAFSFRNEENRLIEAMYPSQCSENPFRNWQRPYYLQDFKDIQIATTLDKVVQWQHLTDAQRDRFLHTLQAGMQLLQDIPTQDYVFKRGGAFNADPRNSKLMTDEVSQRYIQYLKKSLEIQQKAYGTSFTVEAKSQRLPVAPSYYSFSPSLFPPATPPQMITLEGHERGVTSLVVLPGGRIVSGSWDATLKVWSPDNEACLMTLGGHKSGVCSIAVMAGDREVVSGSADKTLRVWDLISGTCRKVLDGHTEPIYSLLMLPDNKSVVSGSDDASLKAWDLTLGTCLTLKEHTNWVRSLAVLPGGLLISGSEDYTLKLWNLSRGTCRKTLTGHKDRVTSVVVLSSDLFISGSLDKTIKVWNLNSSVCQKTLEGHTGGVTCLAVLPRGWVVSGGWDKTLRVWDPTSGTCQHILEGHAGEVTCLAVLPGGLVISGSKDGTLRVWDPIKGSCLKVLEGHGNWVTCLAVLSDGSGRFVSGSRDKTLKVWPSIALVPDKAPDSISSSTSSAAAAAAAASAKFF